VICVIKTQGVVEGDLAEWTFPADPGAVRAARGVVCEQLHTWGLESVRDIASLVVSELVTNAVRYAHAPIGVRLTHRPQPPGTLLVEVSDPVPDPPREQTAGDDDESGRGLHLLAMCSRRWGTRATGPDGKIVWFELSVPAVPAVPRHHAG
jgi:anti-sigma regulatory factor (Ser/Thr protein kinase)